MPNNNTLVIPVAGVVRTAVLCVSLLMCFRIIQFFPGMIIIQEGWFLAVGLAMIGIYLPWRIRQAAWPIGFELYLIILMLAVPWWGAIMAKLVFGQPLIYGLLAQRGFILVGGAPLLLILFLRRGTISSEDVGRALLLLAWMTMTLYTLMASLFDPGSFFLRYGNTFVTSDGPDAKFKFDLTFILFGYFYYLFRGYQQRSFRKFMKAIPFLLFILVQNQGRSGLLSLAGASIFLLYLRKPKRVKITPYLLKIGVTIGVVFIVTYFLNPNFMKALGSKFSDAFAVVFKWQMTDDPSANARIQETIIAMPYIFKSAVFGNGVISHQWMGGPESILNAYFYADDIGIIGVIFTYGLFGLIAFGFMFRFAVLYYRRIKGKLNFGNEYLNPVIGLIIFLAINSLTTAGFVFHPEIILTFIALLRFEVFQRSKMPINP